MTAVEGKSRENATLIAPCVTCGLGRGIVGLNECETCPQGKYSDHIGSTACAPCPEGTFSGNTGATSKIACKPCEAGKGNDLGSTSEASCTVCGASYYSTAGSRCTKCPVGKRISDPDGFGAGTSADLHDSEDDCVEGTPTFYPPDQQNFYDIISVYGNNKLIGQANVILPLGTFTCGVCNDIDNMYQVRTCRAAS